MIKGRIHSFESFGTVDGPGIRFVIFTQGCPLRCRFCHNRDTWDPRGGKEMSAEEVVNEALKYKTFMEASGGGITVSGGESTWQPEFVEEIFRLAKENELHTCLDTSGVMDIEKIDAILNYTDLVLLDIKHTDPKKSKWLTGFSSDNAMKLAFYLKKRKIPVWIRHVLIPTITDGEDNLKSLAYFLKELSWFERLELLPYHVMGIHKWEDLNVEYTLKDIEPATEKDVNMAKHILKKYGIYAR